MTASEDPVRGGKAHARRRDPERIDPSLDDRVWADERIRFEAVFEHAGLGILVTNSDGFIIASNPAGRQFLDRSAGELIGASLEDFIDRQEVAFAPQTFREVMTGQRERGRAEQRFVRGDGRAVWADLTVTRITSAYSDASLGMIMMTDITDRREAEALIRHMAYHDSLTGLPNRILFLDRLDQEFAREPSERHATAVLCLNLDRFADINDTLGHTCGDEVLKRTARRLRDCLAKSDTLARLSGDEFAVILSDAGRQRDAINAAAEVARRLLDVLVRPFVIHGVEAAVSASIGIALCHGNTDASHILRQADLALARAKADSRGGFRFFEAHMNARLEERKALENDFRQALRQGELSLYFQPQVDIETGRVTGAEALVRWTHDVRGAISPAVFIPLAEETGLIQPLGAWVLDAACCAAAAWPDHVKVAVNLSPAQFKHRDLPGLVADSLSRSGLPPSRLELEITEGILLRDTQATLDTLRIFKEQGVTIAMDDFGTGYSSLSYLRRFPFDKIKIDGSFVRDLDRDPDAKAIVRSVVALSRSLGMRAIAEGVETVVQLELLRAEKCPEVQGFLFGKPMPEEAFAELLRREGALRPLRAA